MNLTEQMLEEQISLLSPRLIASRAHLFRGFTLQVLTLAVLLTLIAAGCRSHTVEDPHSVTAVDDSATPSPSGTSTASPKPPDETAEQLEPPRWHYFGALDTFPCAFGPESIWFGGYDSHGLVRYDTRTGQSTSFTLLDGLPLERRMRRIIVASDETTVIMTDSPRQPFVWTPENGWHALPTIAGVDETTRIEDLAFTRDDRLLALTDESAIHAWEDDAWQFITEAPQARGMISVEGGLVLLGTRSRGRPDAPQAIFLSLDEPGESHALELPFDTIENTPYTRLGEKIVLLRHDHRFRYGQFVGASTAWQVSAEGFEVLNRRRFLALDLEARTLWEPRLTDADGERLLLPDRHDEPRLPVRQGGGAVPRLLRDQNGHYWNRNQRWDGERWQSFEVEWALPGGRPWDVLRGRHSLDEQLRWRVIDSEVPMNIWRYDSDTRTGWLSEPGQRHRVTLLEFDADGHATPIQTYEAPADRHVVVLCRDRLNNWWLAHSRGGSPRTVVRLAPDGQTRTYPDIQGASALVESDDGRLWTRVRPRGEHERTLYYDPQEDTWLPGEIHDAFALQFGPWTLANVPGRTQEYDYGTLYRRKDEQWQRMPDPFGNRNVVRGFPRMFFNDRMVVNTFGQLAEYDVHNDRWIYLLDGGWRPMFDDAGRRIFIVPHGILVLTGDPFGPLHSSDASMPGRHDPDTHAMSEVLKLMDHPEWRIREDATDQLKAMFEDIPTRLSAVLEQEDLSLEVRSRIRATLDQLLASDRPVEMSGESLLRRMHPLIETIDKEASARVENDS